MPVTGSRKWFKYTADDGTIFAFQSDEGNQEALASLTGESVDYTGADTTKYAVPGNVRKRMSYWGQGDSTISIPVGSPDQYNSLGPGGTLAVSGIGNSSTATNYTFLRKRPEQISYPRADDTGINDGDPD